MTMTTRLDAAYLTIITALGLQLGCASRTEAEAGDETETEASTGDGDGEPGDGDGEPGDGDGEPGDGDGEPGDGDGEPPEEFTCNNPVPIMQAGTEEPSGFVECDGGFVHRVEAVECVTPQGPDSASCADASLGCQAADCMAKPYGSCQYDDFFGGCGCTYGCATDADCEADQVCVCAGVVGPIAQCLPADCAISVDCGAGLCGLSTLHDVCGDFHALACAGPNECHVDGECPDAPCPDLGGTDVAWHCEGAPGGGWSCQPPGYCHGACGRPLLVEGHARLAAVIERGDWVRASTSASLDAQTRRMLAEHWTQVGRFEHASVASFARFAVHLLRLGAPPRLLRETHAAMADEIEHARLAFGLASAYAGMKIGPGALDVRGSIAAEIDRFAIVEALIHEACIGETLAAIEAGEAATLARDPAVATVLERIAADEMRHAQLGWRSLRWMLDVGDAQLRSFVLARLDAALREVMAATVDDGIPESLREHGLLDDDLRTRVRHKAAAELIDPCVTALRRWHEQPTSHMHA